jgi:hypothetical protein
MIIHSTEISKRAKFGWVEIRPLKRMDPGGAFGVSVIAGVTTLGGNNPYTKMSFVLALSVLLLIS